MSLHRLTALLLLTLAMVSALRAAESAETATPLEWATDFAAATGKARAENRVVLLNFTGSDWCVWCHRLRDEVFLTAPFAAYAAKDAVLVEVDFPRKKTLPAALKAQNDQLAARYSVNGYPTVVLVAADGRELGRTGYIQGGPKTFIRELRRFAKKAGT